MVQPAESVLAVCIVAPTNKKKTWLYDEYYIGERDDKDRKHGHGENHWTGAESIEWYTGNMVRNTMHGLGDYRWRYSGPRGEFVTYEGHFFANDIHGYGVMSYPDGRLFTGLYCNNIRWGPGEERFTTLRANVGFWRGDQLLRLVWRPDTQCLVPDLTKGNKGPAFVEPFRTLMATKLTIIGETNSAIELLKSEGADPLSAVKQWTKLYPTNCTDLRSPMCHVDVWTYNYYGGKIQSLVEDKPKIIDELSGEDDNIREDESNKYFSWNDTPIMMEIMKHCYKHDEQRKIVKLNLQKILSGVRQAYKPPGEHESDCRILLMASYLGHIMNVAQLVNEANVHPDIADAQGNTALMYATCGNQDQIIHFLFEAGADVNSLNDSCCTPLGVALMWFLCSEREIAPRDMVGCLLSTPSSPRPQDSRTKTASEWLINRDSNVRVAPVDHQDNPMDIKLVPNDIPKISTAAGMDDDMADDILNKQKRLLFTINQEYRIRIKQLFDRKNAVDSVPIFVVRDLVNDVIRYIEEQLAQAVAAAKILPKNKSVKVLKEIKTSKENVTSKIMNSSSGHKNLKASQTSVKVDDDSEGVKKSKVQLSEKNMSTILQLLSDGADPRMVKCPKPALILAIACSNTDLIKHLVRYGADINEIFPELNNYRPLDFVVALPFTYSNLEVLRTVLECGADTNYRLNMPVTDEKPDPSQDILGPTLLHAVLTRKTDFAIDEEIRNQVIQTLLQYNCDPTVKFRDQTVIEMAMNMEFPLLDLFVKTPGLVNLNAVINEKNQTILVKMFSGPYFLSTTGTDRFPILTKLLLYGADPLIKCCDGDTTYGNMYEYTKRTLYDEMEYKPPSESATDIIDDKKGKAVPKKKKSISKAHDYESCIEDYLEALQLMTQCGRVLHIRWIQAKLVRELVDVIGKYKHRFWNVIIKEHHNKKCAALWLNPQRCFEIWDLFKETKRRFYQEELVLRHLICIVLFYNNRWSEDGSFGHRMTITEKRTVDSAVKCLIKEYKWNKSQVGSAEEWRKKYVKPELCSIHDKKFNICFDCASPLTNDMESNLCSECKMVSFCSKECLMNNIERAGCHPCSDYLKQKYIMSEPSITEDRGE